MVLNFENIYEYLSNTYIVSILTIFFTSGVILVLGWMTSQKRKEEINSPIGNQNDCSENVCLTGNYHGTEEICSTPEEDSALEQMTDSERNFQNIARHVNVAATAEKMIMSGLTKDQMSEEYVSQESQLAEIFKLMQNQEEKFGGLAMSMDEMYEQMKLYRISIPKTKFHGFQDFHDL